MSFQLIHTADNHLDITQPLPPEKLADRRNDFMLALDQMIDYALGNKPDGILIAGDVFDKRIPRNPPRVHLVKRMRELHEAGIKVFIIGGNHDTPGIEEEGKLAVETLSKAGFATVFPSFERFHHAHLRRGRRTLAIHGISYNPLNINSCQLERPGLKINHKFNVILVHGAVTGGPFTPDLDEMEIGNPITWRRIQKMKADYIALGHYHNYQYAHINDTLVCYPGSTERLSFSEVGHDKGFVWLELDGEGPRHEFIKLDTRKMIDLKQYDCTDGENLTEEVVTYLKNRSDPEAMVKLRLVGKVPREILLTYNEWKVRQALRPHFFHVFIDRTGLIEQRGEIIIHPELGTPIEEFKKYVVRRMEEFPARKNLYEKALELGVNALERARGERP